MWYCMIFCREVRARVCPVCVCFDSRCVEAPGLRAACVVPTIVVTTTAAAATTATSESTAVELSLFEGGFSCRPVFDGLEVEVVFTERIAGGVACVPNQELSSRASVSLCVSLFVFRPRFCVPPSAVLP